ncbi:MAG: DNA polymerase III subunit chi [Betaproteobacteria bacterium]|nr:DNA polymerase III subunit chi [Betaproteobacteria bacterium]
MTQIDFYTHVEDKLKTACRLTGKAFGRGLRVVVYCPDTETLEHVDRLLWTTPPIGFVPHCTPANPLAVTTPVIVAADGTELPHDEVLLNLRDEWPPFFSRFQRLVEIVSLEAGDRERARERYRFYRDRGYEIRSHDLSKLGE